MYGASRILDKSEASIGIFNYMGYMYIQDSPVEILILLQRNLIGRSMTAPPSVIAQYSSATFILLSFQPSKEIFGMRFRNVVT
jgi:hypothetical protein